MVQWAKRTSGLFPTNGPSYLKLPTEVLLRQSFTVHNADIGG